MSPTIDNLNVTMGKANNLVDHLDGVIVENREEIHDSLVRLQSSLADAQRMINDLDDTLGRIAGTSTRRSKTSAPPAKTSRNFPTPSSNGRTA